MRGGLCRDDDDDDDDDCDDDARRRQMSLGVSQRDGCSHDVSDKVSRRASIKLELSVPWIPDTYRYQVHRVLPVLLVIVVDSSIRFSVSAWPPWPQPPRLPPPPSSPFSHPNPEL